MCAFFILYSILQIKILEISGYIIPLTYISLPIIYCCPRPNPLHAKVAKCKKKQPYVAKVATDLQNVGGFLSLIHFSQYI